MARASGYLVDTNILLRLSLIDDPLHRLIKVSISELNGQGAGLYFSLQNIAEFWNVCTRPAERNGYGLAIAEAGEFVEQLERTLSFLPDSDRVYTIWRELVISHNVRGVQVHDARLVAIMRAYGLAHILTLNQSDFVRYAGIEAVHPSQVQASSR
jgi:predicted nucleic acid-binding protein